MSVDALANQLTLEEKAALTRRNVASISPSHSRIGPMAATWAERQGGTA
jgi:hypothetical protein